MNVLSPVRVFREISMYADSDINELIASEARYPASRTCCDHHCALRNCLPDLIFGTGIMEQQDSGSNQSDKKGKP